MNDIMTHTTGWTVFFQPIGIQNFVLNKQSLLARRSHKKGQVAGSYPSSISLFKA
jgi:hypothetical protein